MAGEDAFRCAVEAHRAVTDEHEYEAVWSLLEPLATATPAVAVQIALAGLGSADAAERSVATPGWRTTIASTGSASHTTVLDLLDRLCSHHHDLKTIDNWVLLDGRGNRAFVPPDDPRNPRQSERAA